MGGPADANQHPVRPGNADFVQTPRAVTENAARSNDQVINARRDLIDIGRANEDAERVVLGGDLPGSGPSLGQMDLAMPPRHDRILSIPAGPCEAVWR